MEFFWKNVQTQANLRALPQPQREDLLDRAIDDALADLRVPILSPWDHAYVNVERQRLHALLVPWLEIELDRPPFEVQQQELKLNDQQLGPIRLNLRVDRVDTTAAGPLIIDYKTGAASPSDWLSPRPEAPQLPLYAVLAPSETLGGIAFALLRAGDDLCLKGLTDHPSAVLKNPTRTDLTLEQQREEWHEVLTNLATAFAEGDTRVDPKNYPNTCQYCTQRLLCRLDPTTLNTLPGDNQGPEA